MIVQIDDKFINISLVRSVEWDGTYTRLFFANNQHDVIKLSGDYRSALVKASGGSKLMVVVK